MAIRKTLTLFLASVIGCSVGCSQRPKAATVPGPESTNLLPATSGYIVMTQPRGGIIAIRLPDLKEATLRKAAAPEPIQTYDFPFAYAVSGPDENGLIAYIDDYFMERPESYCRHALKTMPINGSKETEVFSRPGSVTGTRSPLGGNVIGKSFALSPTGGCVALISQLAHAQMPSALLQVGFLEIWDVNKKTGAKVSDEVLDEGLAWLPDGKRVVFVKLIARDHIPGTGPNSEAAKTAFPRWPKVPLLFIHDTATGKESFLTVGRFPVVSNDGKNVLAMRNLASDYRSTDIATGESSSVAWSGLKWARDHGGMIASTADDVVLSWCLPTEGAAIKHTTSNSPLVGPKQMLALKLTKLNSGSFQTVVPSIDPRWRVSYGKTVKLPEK